MSTTVQSITPGTTILFGYTDAKGALSVREVEVMRVDDRGFYALCHLRNAARRFLYERIVPDSVHALAPAPSADAAALVTRLGRSLVTLSHTAALDAADAALLADAVDDARRLYRTVA
jgi:predicted DNA-binding transcriptional regulator YafY